VFIANKDIRNMIGRMFFKLLSESSKIKYLQEKGTVLGTRLKNGRKAYLYMIKDFCVEVTFRQDNEELAPERVTTFSSVQEFNSYLEREFRTAF
jgi:hypothetical protein